MSIEESIKNAMKAMIERTQEISDIEVSSWEEEFDVYSFGGCETCGPEYEKEYTVSIYYRWENTPRVYTYTGSFTDLIKELDG